MTRRRHSGRKVLLVAALVLLGSAFVLLGRLERRNALDRSLAGIDRIRLLTIGAQPDAYRLTPTLACLLYGRGADSYALELCYDLHGGLVEAIDRRALSPVFWDITYEPAAARVHVAPAKLAAVLRGMKAFKLLRIPPGVLPSGLQDYGPRLRGDPYRPPA